MASTVAALRDVLGSERLAEAWSRGGRMAEEALSALRDAAPEQPEPGHCGAGLTGREAEILRLVATGMTDADGAHELSSAGAPSTPTCGRSTASSTCGRATRYALEHDLG